VNLELALAYRARSSGKSLKLKAKNAHLYLKFYLPGSVALPVWVELRGFISTMRVRLQLTPDPPFFALATITFLGQPKASLSCVPLSRHNLNIMDVPLISSFVQSSIDAALAEFGDLEIENGQPELGLRSVMMEQVRFRHSRRLRDFL